jgi:tyrosinase
MTFTRRNVWELGADWADPILWYARGVKAMKSRALKEPTGWRFYAAIHGMDKPLWRKFGYLHSTDPMPSAADVKTYWSQCQHGSWYFLPWHRGYLIALEAVVRDAIASLGGPSTTWALPYWNYFKPKQDRLPPAFASPDWPDGKGDNPLYVKQRYGPNNDGKVQVPVNRINLNALGDPDFAGVASGGGPGFGGVDTGFSHGGQVHGGVETQPHDWVHGLVGGSDGQSDSPGLMSDPDTAGLDPIFWLHHANIDRLWEVWRRNPATHVNPPDAHWVDGPTAVGERTFVLPMPGGERFTYTPGQMTDLSKLGYAYDDVSTPFETPQPVSRLQRLGANPAVAQSIGRSTAMVGPKTVELLGANAQSLRLVGTDARTSVALDASVQRKVSASLQSVTAAKPSMPDRVFLNLENVRGLNDATAFNVYINLPDGEDPAKHPEHLAGSVALFGVRKASLANEEHAGDGLTFVLEISHVIDTLHLAGAQNLAHLDVRLVPQRPVPESAQISIGRISVFRQST